MARDSLWPPDVWAAALIGAGDEDGTRPVILSSIQQAVDFCAEKPHKEDWRVWAFDLPKLPGGGGAPAPKRFLAATVAAFVNSYMCVPPGERHAYEVLAQQRACWAYFDLDGDSPAARHAELDKLSREFLALAEDIWG